MIDEQTKAKNEELAQTMWFALGTAKEDAQRTMLALEEVDAQVRPLCAQLAAVTRRADGLAAKVAELEAKLLPAGRQDHSIGVRAETDVCGWLQMKVVRVYLTSPELEGVPAAQYFLGTFYTSLHHRAEGKTSVTYSRIECDRELIDVNTVEASCDCGARLHRDDDSELKMIRLEERNSELMRRLGNAQRELTEAVNG